MVLTIPSPTRRGFLGLALACSSGGLARAGAADGLQLLMIRSKGCVWCARWDREIGPVYAASPEGRLAPLVMLDVGGPYPDGLVLARMPWLTPSFILVRRGAEVTRQEGYPGARQFFPVLRDMIEQARALG